MLLNPKGEDRDDRVGAIVRATQHAFARRIVEVPLLLTIDRATPAHQVILPIVLERAGDAVAYLARGVAPTVIRARIVHRALAGTRGGRGDLRQVAQLVGMRTITGEVLFLGAASVLGSLPELAQVCVGILVGVGATRSYHGSL